MKIILLNIILTCTVLSQMIQTDLPREKSEFAPIQDSLYRVDLYSRLANFLRIRKALDELDFQSYMRNLNQSNPWRIANATINDIPDEFLRASGTELVQRQLMLMDAMHVPFVPTLLMGGMKVNLDEVGRFIGLLDDYSPTIKYKLDHHTDIEIVIYSIKAVVIATIFQGPQAPGLHQRTWNLRNSEGKKMPPGDYIAEVRIGNHKFYRKRILIQESD